MLRFLHLADVHFDTRFKSQSRELRTILKESQREAFQAAINCALEEKVNCVLLGGDLFDQERLSFESERFLLSELGRLHEANIPCVYATGNHDPGGSHFRTLQIPWPESFQILWKPEPQPIEIVDEGGQVSGLVVGAGHSTRHVEENLAARFPSLSGGVPNIGLLHTWVTTARTAEEHDRYAPCAVHDLKRCDYAYWALGHVHVCQQVDETVEAWYPGILQGRHFKESGAKGGLLVTVPDNGNPEVEFRPFARACWNTLRVSGLEAAHSLNDVRKIASQEMANLREEHSWVKDWFLRVEMEGSSPLKDLLSSQENLATLTEELTYALDATYVELVTRNLTPPVDVDEFREGTHILGEVLTLIERAQDSEELLEKLCPSALANETQDRLKYVRSLLNNLDSEAVVRFLRAEHED